MLTPNFNKFAFGLLAGLLSMLVVKIKFKIWTFAFSNDEPMGADEKYDYKKVPIVNRIADMVENQINEQIKKPVFKEIQRKTEIDCMNTTFSQNQKITLEKADNTMDEDWRNDKTDGGIELTINDNGRKWILIREPVKLQQ